eukprot:6211243-Pleurochrysis_carterae.AAC.2
MGGDCGQSYGKNAQRSSWRVALFEGLFTGRAVHAFCFYTLYAAEIRRYCVWPFSSRSVIKHSASHIWFNLIFNCRVLNLVGVLNRIQYSKEGRHVCGGAVAAVYAIPLATL